MVVLRILALLLIAVALMLLGADALDSLENGVVTLRDTSEFWALIHAGSLESVETWLANAAGPEWLLATLTFLLNVPAWAVTGVLGIFLAILAELFGGRRSDY